MDLTVRASPRLGANRHPSTILKRLILQAADRSIGAPYRGIRMDPIGIVLTGLSLAGVALFSVMARAEDKRVDRLVEDHRAQRTRAEVELDLGRLRMTSMRMEWCDLSPEARRMYIDLYGEPPWVKPSTDRPDLSFW